VKKQKIFHMSKRNLHTPLVLFLHQTTSKDQLYIWFVDVLILKSTRVSIKSQYLIINEIDLDGGVVESFWIGDKKGIVPVDSTKWALTTKREKFVKHAPKKSSEFYNSFHLFAHKKMVFSNLSTGPYIVPPTPYETH